MTDTATVLAGLDMLNSAIAAHSQQFAQLDEDGRAALLDDIRSQVREQLAERAAQEREAERAVAAKRFALQRRVGLLEQLQRAVAAAEVLLVQALQVREGAQVETADPLRAMLTYTTQALEVMDAAAADDKAVLEAMS